MKKNPSTLQFIIYSSSFSPRPFFGITTSKRVGIINIGMNPSELANLSSKFEVQTQAASINVSNNKVGFKDIINGDNLENKFSKEMALLILT
jgi:hypothetical protein